MIFETFVQGVLLTFISQTLPISTPISQSTQTLCPTFQTYQNQFMLSLYSWIYNLPADWLS